MQDHHLRAIERLAERFRQDPTCLSVIIGGSIAKGRAAEFADIDFVLVVTDEEYQKRLAQNHLHYFATDLCDYPGGYVDGKIVDLQFLRDVANHGSEPARAAFSGAFIAWSRIPELEGLLKRIVAYPEQAYQENIRSFYAQVEAMRWYLGEAERRADRYLLMHAASELVLFGGRMILAYNRILYPYHKWFMYELEHAPRKPERFMELTHRLLENPCTENANAFCESLFGFTQWDTPPEGWPARFMRDSEWNWRDGRTPVADR